MEEKIEEMLRLLEKAVETAEKDKLAKQFVGYGRKIIEYVDRKDYSDARFFYNTDFLYALREANIRPEDKQVVDYWDAVMDLVKTLPIR